MSSLLEAANAEPNKIEVTDQLPKRIGDVSIMSLMDLYILCNADPTSGYDTSTYYVYGICDFVGITGSRTGSTSDNLQAVGLDWYKQLNKPTTSYQTWTQAGHKVFGGPFYGLGCDSSSYFFWWWYSTNNTIYSPNSYYWGFYVDASIYVAVVRALE